jgi:opine dehydrogenase
VIVTIVGGGNGAHAALVDQCLRGHDVRWYRRDAASFPTDGHVSYDGVLGSGRVAVAMQTDDLREAVADADLVLAPIPANDQAAFLDALLPVLDAGQAVAFTPGTLGTWLGARHRPDVTFLETGTLPYLCRITRPFHVVIPVTSHRLPVGSIPGVGEQADAAHATFTQAYPTAVRVRDGLDGALCNWGPIIHPPLLVHNLGAIESLGDRFDIHDEGTSPSVRRNQVALDAERIALRRALDLPGSDWPLDDYYAGAKTSMYPADAKPRLIASNLWRESIDLDHRYLTEDIVCGLVLNVSLARVAGVPAPTGEAILQLLDTALDRRLFEEGRTAASLGIDDLGRAQRLAQDGFPDPVPVGR